MSDDDDDDDITNNTQQAATPSEMYGKFKSDIIGHRSFGGLIFMSKKHRIHCTTRLKMKIEIYVVFVKKIWILLIIVIEMINDDLLGIFERKKYPQNNKKKKKKSDRNCHRTIEEDKFTHDKKNY